MLKERYNLIDILSAQEDFSYKICGTGEKDAALIAHIKEELKEIEAAPGDVEEWIDVIILAMDGALRHVEEPVDVADVLLKKMAKNRKRQWPDWRTVPSGKPIHHIK